VVEPRAASETALIVITGVEPHWAEAIQEQSKVAMEEINPHHHR
jgi:hypothetical protein